MLRSFRLAGIGIVVLSVFGCGSESPRTPGGAAVAAVGADLDAVLATPGLRLAAGTAPGDRGFARAGDAFVHGQRGAAADPRSAPPFEARIERDGTVSVRAHDALGGVRLRPVRSPLVAGAPALHDGRVVLPAGDDALVYRVKGNGLKEDIVLARARGDVLAFEWELVLDDGLEAAIDAHGNVNVYGPGDYLSGDVQASDEASRQAVERARRAARKDHLVYRLPAPIVRDATGAVGGQARFELQGGRLTLHAARLAALAYPISIDPTIYISSTADFGLLGNLESGALLGSGEIQRSRTRFGAGAWTTTTSVTTGRSAHALTAYNGFLYAVGGSTSTGASTSVEFAPINADGTVGAWSPATSLPSARYGHAVVAYGGALYVSGGYTTTYSAEVLRAAVNADGTLGGWTAETSLPSGRNRHGFVAYGGHLYVIGGYNTTSPNYRTEVYYAALRGNGSLGPWNLTASLPVGLNYVGAAVHLGWIYVHGGTSATGNEEEVYRARVTGTGALDGWLGVTSLPTARYGNALFAYSGYLYSVGGYSGGYLTDTLAARIDAAGTLGSWVATSTLPTGRRSLMAVPYKDSLYAVGGYGSGDAWMNQVLFAPLDQTGTLLGQAWRTETAAPTARYGHTVLAHGNNLYVIGGYDSTYLATVYKAPIGADGVVGSWTKLSSFTTARYRHASVVANGYLYVIGGRGSAVYLDDVQKAAINPDGTIGSFTTTATFGGPRYMHAAAALNGYLYVIGGIDSSSGILGDVQKAVIATDGNLGGFSATTGIGTGRYGPGVAVNGNRIYVVGGQYSSSKATSVLYATPAADGTIASWSTGSSSLPTGRYGSVVVIHHGFMYVMGGYTDSGPTADVLVAPMLAAGSPGPFVATTALPATRYLFGGAASDGRLYAVAGYNGTTLGDVVSAAVNSNGTVAPWGSGTSLPAARRGHGMVSSNGYLFVVGGLDSTLFRAEVYRSMIDPMTGAPGTWSAITPALPGARAGAGVEVLNGRLWVTGGNSSLTVFSPVVYHATISSSGAIGTWETATALPSGRMGHALVAAQGKFLYAIGGYNTTSQAMDEVWMAQPAGDGSISAWTAVTALPQKRYLHSAAYYNGYLYAVGGDSGTGVGHSTVYSALVNTDGTLGAWSQTMSLPVQLKQHTMVAANGFFHVIGGYDGDQRVWTAPVLPYGHLGPWTSTSPLATGVHTAAAVADRGRVYLTGGASGTSTYSSVRVATLNTPAAAGEYSRVVDFGVVGRWDGFVWSGTSLNAGGLYLHYRLADDDTVFGAIKTSGSVPRTTWTYPDEVGVRYAFVRLLLDNTLTATVNLDVSERDVDYFYLSYTDLCAGVVCVALDQCHDVGVCDPYTGVCSNPNKTNGIACNDSNACTLTDTCQGGVCTGGSAVVCAALGQCYYAGTCNTATGLCDNPFKPASESCDDGRACTTGDHCDGNGGCVAGVDNCACTSSADCTPRHACELQGTCNTVTGACTYPPAPVNTVCTDGSLCTQTDRCDGNGNCVGGNAVVCTALDQCHDVGTCNPATGVCTNPVKADGTGCNDSNACSQTDTCQGGACTGSSWKTCTALDQCHDVGICDPATGNCSNPNKADGTECTDGSKCTLVDRCAGGSCVPGTPVVCTALDQCHQAGTCDPATGVCSDPSQPNGTGCDDGNLCTRTDTCQGGGCVGGNAVVCTALDQCHKVGTCDPGSGQCSNPAQDDGTTCNDSSQCTTGEKCVGGVCGSPTSTVTCTALDQCHDVGTCAPATGVCSNPATQNGTLCDDGKSCTTGDACQSGACVPAVNNCGCLTSADCVALDQCHENGTCGADYKCTYPQKADTTPCDDGNACTQTDACQAGVCTGANPKTCAAPDQCHDAGACDPGSGTCTYPNKTDGTACDDGDRCTQSDTCQLGACVGANPKLCANDQCRFGGTCVPATGECDGAPKPDGTDCSDGNKCTQNDKCSAGSCAGTVVTCAALDSCHNAGTCNAATGLCSNPPKLNGTGCDDGNACTSGEQCTNGVCGNPTSVVSCSPSDQCHSAGVCDSQTGSCSDPIRPNATRCNDGKDCTSGDACQAGVCTPTANDCACAGDGDCPPLNPCQASGSCNLATSKCEYVNQPDGSSCDDGDACTTGETCQGGACGSPTATVVCTALDQCHAVGQCDPVSGACTDPIKADGAGCDDGRSCTTGDACQAGVCIPAVNDCPCALDSDCPPPSQCYDQGTCNTGTARCVDVPKADGTPCDDANECTNGANCQSGICGYPTSIVSCTALDSCHGEGVCDPATGRCSDPLLDDATACDDGDSCTIGEACQGGLCTGGTASCQDGGVPDGGVPDGAVADAGGDGAAPADGAAGDGAVKQEVKSYLSCAVAAAGSGAAAGPLGLLLAALGAALARRRRR